MFLEANPRKDGTTDVRVCACVCVCVCVCVCMCDVFTR